MLRALTYFVAAVWLANGLLAKVLNLVPRHTEIVAGILGPAHARTLTIMIGVSEIAMGLWILTGRYRKQTAVIQIAIILTMNTLESILVPELLLWGYWNPVFALLFCGVVWWWGTQPERASLS
ncbi:hypothetical protein FUA23_06360 [Neolewinella aurantiaca]|uniref:DoxX-like protein n=1 Tax=Neolewinella aurantiaca TaxID=2602767 RepID=A0A5C7FUW8_9BACT|nr:DoxX-like family protein [Neolewinella aurantiaca]TXF90410.1 hypothetical protein FUA23_06360 [Neolewinella aurantiaca]